MTRTKRDILVLQDWGLGVRPTTSPREIFYVEKPSKLSRMGLINRRRSGYKKNDLIFCTWKVGTLFKIGALITLISPLREYRLDVIVQKTRWQGKDLMYIV